MLCHINTSVFRLLYIDVASNVYNCVVLRSLGRRGCELWPRLRYDSQGALRGPGRFVLQNIPYSEPLILASSPKAMLGFACVVARDSEKSNPVRIMIFASTIAACRKTQRSRGPLIYVGCHGRDVVETDARSTSKVRICRDHGPPCGCSHALHIYGKHEVSRGVPFMSILLPTWLLSSRQVPSMTTARVQLEACPSLSLYEPAHVFPFITHL